MKTNRRPFKLAVILLSFFLTSCSLLPVMTPSARKRSSKEETSEVDSDSERSSHSSLYSNHRHTWGEWVAIQEATCETNGARYRECTTCHEREYKDIPALGHDFDSVQILEGDRVFAECRICHASYDVSKDYSIISLVDPNGSVFSQYPLKKNSELSSLPEYEDIPAGKRLYGWMNINNGGQIWDFKADDLNCVKENISLMPLIVDDLDVQTFEAELCPAITESNGGQGMEGCTYSGGQRGSGLIYRDYSKTLKASGNYIFDNRVAREATVNEYVYTRSDECFNALVHFNYNYGNTLTWEIESDVAVNNVTMLMRLSAEYGNVNRQTDERTISFSDQDFQVKVNHRAISYGNITMRNIPSTYEMITCQDFFLSNEINLVKGTNVIELIVNNENPYFDCLPATSPCIDCIKFISSSTLTWPNAKISNIVY